MATAAVPQGRAIRENTQFFTVMAFVMAIVILAGFRSISRWAGRASMCP